MSSQNRQFLTPSPPPLSSFLLSKVYVVNRPPLPTETTLFMDGPTFIKQIYFINQLPYVKLLLNEMCTETDMWSSKATSFDCFGIHEQCFYLLSIVCLKAKLRSVKLCTKHWIDWDLYIVFAYCNMIRWWQHSGGNSNDKPKNNGRKVLIKSLYAQL